MKALLLIGALAATMTTTHASDLRVRLRVSSCNPHWSGNQLARLVFDEVARLKQIIIVDDTFQYEIRCTAIPVNESALSGYAVSIIFLSSDGRLLADIVREHSSLEGLARDIAHVVKYTLPTLEDT